MEAWIEERMAIEGFARGLSAIRSFPEASESELDAYAIRVAGVTELLTLVADTPKDKRPPVQQWDRVLGPLFFQLFEKGDDIDRYTLADIWREILLEEGEIDAFLRSCNSVAASARNFYRLDEALEVCRQGREAAGSRISAALANLLNMEGIIHFYGGDYDASEASFREASAMTDGVPEEDFFTWTGVSRADFKNRLSLNTMESYLRRGSVTRGKERAKFTALARASLSRLERKPLSETHRNFLMMNIAVLAIVEERLDFAKSLLVPLATIDPEKAGASRSYLAVFARLLSRIAILEGNWDEAFQWVRKAIRLGVRYSRVGVEQDVLEQALDVLGGLKAQRESSSHDALVEDLLGLLEEKDWYTGRSHARGVSRMSVRLGEYLNRMAGCNLDLRTLETAGLLHDIGKLKTPWSLLNKIAPLGPKEWSILKDHPVHGEEILRRIGMEEIAPIVRSHHEQIDGTGYPDGRAPDLLAAIVGVSDIFEAATTPTRRYKMPKDPSTLFEELARGAGRSYHPDVVNALRKIA